MQKVTLGKTGICVEQNAFGALPIQRVDKETAKTILLKAYNNGIKFFDTARAYSDSEEKIGYAFEGLDRSSYYIATKTMAKTVDEFWDQLHTSLTLLKTDYIDIYQFHCASKVFKPNDGTGMYEAMLEAKEQGKIRHIGITAHLLNIANEAIESDLYETLQFPFSYLASDKEVDLVKKCKEHNMGFIAMKGLAGGLLNKPNACMAFMSQFDNVLPIWGIQKECELDQWLSFFDCTPVLDDEMNAFIKKEKDALAGDFCRGCGYCMPCPMEITINQCARMSLMLRRAPSSAWLNEHWQKEMAKIETCLECGKCSSKCPYQLNTPALLKKNLEDYKKVLAGEVKVQ
ncbi:MAG: aldo/keto reductase [Holdemanella sp.]|nr:aldo/keto reductase [Holdemanella sp.]